MSEMPDTSKVRRLEVIDHSGSNGGLVHAYMKWREGISVTMQLQDGDKTLKIFINDLQ